MNKNACVSVIVPTYNRAHLLPRAIQSALDQTCEDVEIIVIDDGSTDNTREVLEPFRDRIKYLEGPHQGTANARNIGMRAATGKYIAFLDSDDWYLPYKLELQVAFLEQHPEVKMVCSEFSGADADGIQDEYLMRKYHPVWNRKGWDYEEIFERSGRFFNTCLEEPVTFYIGNIFENVIQDTLIPTNTMLFHKDILCVVGYQNTKYRFGQEYEFCARICKHYDIAFLNIPTYVLYFHESQSTAALIHHSPVPEPDGLLELKVLQVFLDTVEELAHADRQFYAAHRKLVRRRLGELNFDIGKKWLFLGDRNRANEYFKIGGGFKNPDLIHFVYWSMCFMPQRLLRSMTTLFQMAWSLKRRRG